MITNKEMRLKNLKHLVDAKFDGSISAFAKALGKAESQVRRYFYTSKNGRDVGDKFAREIEKYFNKEKGWFDHQLWGNSADQVKESSQSYESTVLVWSDPSDLPEGEFIFVPKLDIKAAAGNGCENGDFPTEQNKVAFRSEWIKKSKAQSNKLVVVGVIGDSMVPTLCSGDDALVDAGQAEIVNGNVYAFTHDSEVKIKRLYRHGDKLIVHSDNQTDPRYAYDQELDANDVLKIIGRVVSRSGSGGL